MSKIESNIEPMKTGIIIDRPAQIDLGRVKVKRVYNGTKFVSLKTVDVELEGKIIGKVKYIEH